MARNCVIPINLSIVLSIVERIIGREHTVTYGMSMGLQIARGMLAYYP